MPSPLLARTPEPKRWLFAVSVFATGWTILLLTAGYITTTIEAGMAFLDWPLSNGSINPEGWTRDPHMAAEHGHRLLGAKLGILAIVLVAWNHLREARRGVRLLAWGILAMVVVQGLLGGLRVLLDQLNLGTESNTLALSFAVMHATGAQLTFGLLATHALVHSPAWAGGRLAPAEAHSRALRVAGVVAVAVLIVQVVLGALVRHWDAGAAIYTFPWSNPDGGLLPRHWNWAVALNFAHRVGAVVASLALLHFVGKVFRTPACRRAAGPLAWIPAVLLVVQVALGWITTVTFINPHAATLHGLVGALLVCSTWMLAVVGHHPPAGKAAPAHG